MEQSASTMHHFNLYFGSGLLLILLGVMGWSLSEKLKKPYTILLVLIGLFVGIANFQVFQGVKTFFTESEIFSVIVISLFLPALLGEAAIKLPFSHLVENKRPVISLAIGGTLITFAIVATGSYYLLHLPIVVSFTFAALMSATDPISVLSIFKSLGVNKKLSTTIEGESLFNDGVAVVLFKISSVFLLSYIDMGFNGVTAGLWMFIKVVSGGILIGGILGYIASRFIKYFDDFPLETAVSFVLFYGSYLIGEKFHVSGVIAVVVAGIIFGNYGRKIGMTPVTQLNINNFWEIIAFFGNTIIFLMVGMEIHRIDFEGKWLMILFAIFIILVARSIAVYSSTYFVKDFPRKYKHVLNWGGLKGSLSIALVLSLPHDFDGRDDILVLTFSIVLFSLIFQGLSIEGLISKLKIIKKDETMEEYEEQLALIHRSKAAIREMKEITSQMFTAAPVYADEIKKHEIVIEDAYHRLEKLFDDYPQLKKQQLHLIKEKALYAEYDVINKIQFEGLISSKKAEKDKESIIDEIVTLITNKEK